LKASTTRAAASPTVPMLPIAARASIIKRLAGNPQTEQLAAVNVDNDAPVLALGRARHLGSIGP
jgi:hypothetical protein